MRMKISEKISSLPWFTESVNEQSNIFIETSQIEEEQEQSKKLSIFPLFQWINRLLYNFLRYVIVGCNSITDVINYYAEHCGEFFMLSRLSDVTISNPLEGQKIRYNGPDMWLNWTNDSYIYTDVPALLTFDYSNWEKYIEFPKDRYGAYKKESTVEILMPYPLYGLTPISMRTETKDDKFYLVVSFTMSVALKYYFNDYYSPARKQGIPVVFRFWDKNPEKEKLPTIDSIEDITWTRTQVPGNKLGNYICTKSTYNDGLENKRLTDSGAIESYSDTYSNWVTDKIPLYATDSIICMYFLNRAIGIWDGVQKLGFYKLDNQGNEIPLGTITPINSNEFCLIPGGLWSQNQIETLKNKIKDATYFRISYKFFNDTNKDFYILQNLIPTSSENNFDCFFSRNANKNGYKKNITLSDFGQELNNFICLDQVNRGENLIPNKQLDYTTGEIDETTSTRAYTSDYIAIEPYEYDGMMCILKTQDEAPYKQAGSTHAKLICAYDENKNYLGYFYDYYRGTYLEYSEKLFRLSANNFTSVNGGNFNDTKYLRYTMNAGSIGFNMLIFKPHEFN